MKTKVVRIAFNKGDIIVVECEGNIFVPVNRNQMPLLYDVITRAIANGDDLTQKYFEFSGYIGILKDERALLTALKLAGYWDN